MADSVSLSRATSISRGSSKAGSALSRQKSLIKKNIQPTDLRPSDILIERFTAWKVIVKQLIAYFEVRRPPPCAMLRVLMAALRGSPTSRTMSLVR